jgi:hypothetical protein
MVAICRVNRAMSAGLMLPPPPNREARFGFFLTRVALMPWRRSSALAMAGLTLVISPLVLRPCLSVPS